MIALLQLFSTDRKLLEIRGNLIIRQLCINLQPERIYRTLADCIEKDEDIEFASIMVQNLNNNLITAPELAELRKRLRNLESRDGQMFFVALFKAWCYNAVATFSLCLLAQAYEQAYNLLQIFADLEMTVNMLIQIDKLVQLLESPVFTCKHCCHHDRNPTDTDNRPPPATPRTRPLPLPLQMSLRSSHAPPSIISLCCAQKPSQQRISNRTAAYSCLNANKRPAIHSNRDSSFDTFKRHLQQRPRPPESHYPRRHQQRCTLA